MPQSTLIVTGFLLGSHPGQSSLGRSGPAHRSVTLTRSTRRPPVSRMEIAGVFLFVLVLSWLALLAMTM